MKWFSNWWKRRPDLLMKLDYECWQQGETISGTIESKRAQGKTIRQFTTQLRWQLAKEQCLIHESEQTMTEADGRWRFFLPTAIDCPITIGQAKMVVTVHIHWGDGTTTTMERDVRMMPHRFLQAVSLKLRQIGYRFRCAQLHLQRKRQQYEWAFRNRPTALQMMMERISNGIRFHFIEEGRSFDLTDEMDDEQIKAALERHIAI